GLEAASGNGSRFTWIIVESVGCNGGRRTANYRRRAEHSSGAVGAAKHECLATHFRDRLSGAIEQGIALAIMEKGRASLGRQYLGRQAGTSICFGDHVRV